MRNWRKSPISSDSYKLRWKDSSFDWSLDVGLLQLESLKNFSKLRESNLVNGLKNLIKIVRISFDVDDETWYVSIVIWNFNCFVRDVKPV